jgi:hypothetical protein
VSQSQPLIFSSEQISAPDFSSEPIAAADFSGWKPPAPCASRDDDNDDDENKPVWPITFAGFLFG